MSIIVVVVVPFSPISFRSASAPIYSHTSIYLVNIPNSKNIEKKAYDKSKKHYYKAWEGINRLTCKILFNNNSFIYVICTYLSIVKCIGNFI